MSDGGVEFCQKSIWLLFNPSPQQLLFLRFLPYCFATPRIATGHGKGEVDVRFATVAVFSTPPSLRATSPIANATPRNTTGHGKGEV